MSHRQSVLVVDTDMTFQQMIRAVLEREAYQVHTASDGLTAVEMAKSIAPDIVILEIELPGLDGFSVCRALSRELKIPLIFLSNRDGAVDKIVGLDSGADDFVTKPFDEGEFLARIRAVLRRHPEVEQVDTIRSRDLHLDLAGRQAFKNQIPLNLSYKEFDLLVELMSHQGEVLPREFLLSKIWGYDAGGQSRTVDVHIRWLREKIEENPSKPRRIVTIQRVGYRFEG